MDDERALEDVLNHAHEFLDGLPERRVGSTATADELRATLGGPLPEGPSSVSDVIQNLIKAADPGIVATGSARFFGFVIGGATPASLAADWLTSLWDQNAGLFVSSPAASVAEDTAGRWLVELLGLPEGSSYGFVTGGQMANFTGLAAARHYVLEQAGWDVETRGLQGAPTVTVVVGEERHSTVGRALRYLGLGSDNVTVVPADDQGRMDVDEFRRVFDAIEGPTIVCTQAGNVNSGSFDPSGEICDIAHEKDAWVHVDGAFGLWAAASDKYRHLLQGAERADSWATDGHKWLNVPYDSGIAFSSKPAAHQAAMSVHASYLIHSETDAQRDEMDWNPEFSRRARGIAAYAAIRALGRSGIREMVERCCACAARFAEKLGSAPGVEVLNDVVLNQVLVRFDDDDAKTRAVVTAIQEDGTLWLSGSEWKGKAVMRISVSNWQTTEADVDRSVETILRLAGKA